MNIRCLVSSFAALLLIAGVLSSCVGGAETENTLPSGGVRRDDVSSAATDVQTALQPMKKPDCIGLYDDLQDDGTYTRLDKWESSWIAGRDIAVFDVIPSIEDVIYGGDYRTMWLEESDKVSSGAPVSAQLLLEYATSDGEVYSVKLGDWRDAEEAAELEYIEVYLYDDIHQDDGAWYSHLTEATTNDETVISSIKLTAGSRINEVTCMKLTAYLTSCDAGAAVELVRADAG